jgi:cysteine-S-conjugate beta-lyase
MHWRTRIVDPAAHAPGGFRSLVTPVYRGSTTVFQSAADVKDTWDHDDAPYTYGLYGTPTTLELGARIAALENGHRSFVTPGGQAAIALTYLAFLSSGDHVLVPENIYGPSRALADDLITRSGITVEYYAPTIGGAIGDLIRDNTRLIWCESPGSVTLEVQDVPAICRAAHARSVPVAIDNTWSAGVLFDAFAHGVDVSVQALTKYIGGHSDILLGSVTLRDSTHYERIGRTHQHLGLAASPEDCALALRGLQSLYVRLTTIEASALTVAHWLAQRSEVDRVLHPALPSCPGHHIWKRDFNGSSGLFSVVFRGDVTTAQAGAFIDALKLFVIGYSWGGVTSLAVPFERGARAEWPHRGPLVRFNIGLEDPADLIADLEHAFTSVAF